MKQASTYFGTYQRKSVRIELFYSYIRFTLEEDKKNVWEISRSNLFFENIGKNNLILKISNKQESELSFFCSNKDIIKDLEKLGLESKLVHVHKKIRKLNYYYFAAVCIPLFFLFLLPFLLMSFSNNWVDKIIGAERLRWLGEQYVLKSVGSNKYEKDSPQTKIIESLISDLQIGDSSFNQMKIKVYVSKSLEPNAFALPGEIIVVNEGFIKKAQTIEEVYGVLAHELAHVKEKHLTKNILQSAGLISGFLIMNIFLGDLSILSKTLFDFKNLSFSRELEREADQEGMNLLLQQNISPIGLISFFEQMSKHDNGQEWLSYLSTHPGFQERIYNLKKMMSEKGINIKLRKEDQILNIQNVFR